MFGALLVRWLLCISYVAIVIVYCRRVFASKCTNYFIKSKMLTMYNSEILSRLFLHNLNANEIKCKSEESM